MSEQQTPGIIDRFRDQAAMAGQFVLDRAQEHPVLATAAATLVSSLGAHGVYGLANPQPEAAYGATPTTPTLAECEREALTPPTSLKARYVDVNDIPGTFVGFQGNMPDMSNCAGLGTRVLKLEKIMVQHQVPGTAPIETRPHKYYQATHKQVTLAYGDTTKKIDKVVRTSMQISCMNSTSKSDGINIARADFRLKFMPKNHSQTSASHSFSKKIIYRYC